ncbi:leucine-rich repeat and guanylate kinase domain-containing protein-like [Babylonia areolata]|uniref:leucine-rich repeat and guanylate kinase domain-containing protein-like n=1 Tax=Babylonia areolata TaxID=304850 RepID=UPI003FD574AA
MADTAMDPTTASPQMDGQYFHTDGDPDLFVPPTDILNLDNMRQPSDIGDADTGLGGEPISKVEEDDYIELSPEGILDEETVSRGLSNLGRSADGMHQVYLNAAMPGFSLVDISILGEFVNLQKVEIPYNNITDLSPLGKLPYLLVLDASHNSISVMLDFVPPKNLKEVDLSYNQLSEMADLSEHHALTKLVLDNNMISEIWGLEECHRLHHLSLAHNQVETIQGMNHLPLRYLNLCHNKIKKIENLETLKNLQTLNLSGNRVRSLEGLANHDLLETIDLEDNEVIDVSEISHIQRLRMLRQLNLLRNPIQELPDYRLAILFRIPSLTELDRHKVEVEEKVSAKDMSDPSLEVVAARDHIMHVVYNFLQPSRVWDSTLPNVETPYPMLVLVGPHGSGKRDLSWKLVEEFSDYFGIGVSHTTRPSRTEEEHGKDYFFVSMEKFEMDIKMGQFVQTSKHHDHWYGLQMEAIESVAREGLACVVHMELEGVLTLKNTYFEPRYVLVMPLDKEAHEHRLRDRGLYTEEQIENTLKRADIYCRYHQDHPGFFDMMITSEDIAEAYRKLRRLVMDYLGISPSTPDASSQAFPPTEVGGEGEPYQAMTGAASTNAMGARTWSKPSIPDSISQVRGQLSSATGRGIVEEESYKRRHSAAKEVVAGYVPPIYEQILTQYPRTAPQTVEEQQGLGLEDSSDNQLASGVNTNLNALTHPEIPGSPDSTTSNASTSSNLSDLDSAAELQRTGSPKTHPGAPVTTHTQPAPTDILPTEKVNPITLIAEKGYNSASKSRLPEARPLSASRQELESGHGNRPGSERHKVLPPIGVAQ